MRLAAAACLAIAAAAQGHVSNEPPQAARFAPFTATQVVVFVARDCPISNAYAPAIQRICRNYAARGVRCTLVYEDEDITDAGVRAHLAEYAYGAIATRIDRGGAIARSVGATVTPEAAIVDTRGAVRYRGRIDNFHAAPGRPRQLVTSHDLRDALDAVLDGRTVERPRTTAVGCYIPRDAERNR